MTGNNFLILAALMVGLLGGVAGSVLKLLTHTIEKYLDQIDWGVKFYILLAFPMIGILLTVLYIKTLIRKSKFEHGMSQLIYSVSKNKSDLAPHNTYSQIITSALTVGFGGSVGLEAPIAVTGAAIGSNTAKLINLNYRDRTLLLACGVAAGISSVFSSPVAGMILALELILPQFTIPAFIPLLISSAVATVVAQQIHPEPLFVLVTDVWKFDALPYYLILGLLVGYFSIFFMSLSNWVSARFKKVKNTYNKIIIGGIILGACIAFFPALYGEGYITIQELLNGHYTYMIENSLFSMYFDNSLWIFGFALVTLFAKSFASLVTLSAGGNGGSFGPSLVMGGILGFVFAFGLNTFLGTDLNITNFIVVGMAACLAGLMHAPLTGIFLIAEITGGYKLMVPLMIVCAIAYYVNRRQNKYSIYTKNLAEKGDLMSLEDRDRTILESINANQIVDRKCLRFSPDSTLEDNRKAILESKKNIFAVVDSENNFIGIVTSETLLEEILKLKQNVDAPKVKMSDLAQPSVEIAVSDESLFDVLNRMERRDLRTIPVVVSKAKPVFVGFITKNAIFGRYRKELNEELQYLD